MNENPGPLTRLALGAAAGLAGTLAIQVLRTASSRWLPQSVPPMREDPGQFMVEHVEEYLPPLLRSRIPPLAETRAARGLAIGYGMTFGALYAGLRPQGGPIGTEGVVLGSTVWATGYAGWLPALGLVPPPWKLSASEALGTTTRHVLYGMSTVAVYDGLLALCRKTLTVRADWR